jgi:hypothetical protein
MQTKSFQATILVWPNNGNGAQRVHVGYFPTAAAARKECSEQLKNYRPDSRGGYDINVETLTR